jgi:signal transduction histidine kinase
VIWLIALPIILGLCGLVFYLQRSRNQLKIATGRQLQLSGMLINAQEKERSRLASELHDDFSQRLALLALGLETAAETIAVSPEEAQRQLHELLNSASEIGADLHTLSHRLHSSTLESLGLVPAVTAFCKEFTTQQGVKIEFKSDGVPRSVERDTALCVFRIVQEALRNLKKHSGASEGLVDLGVSGDKLTLAVQDRGHGFDPAELRTKEGLGIRSMEERARVLGGEFKIQSAPGQGTRVKVWVPLARGKSEESIDTPESLR